mmetsp:Transcript_4703/g.10800  ORF Transcript_4703/g.10800 Transcript_4703/m.10800 type:complete len:211 (+) Transcript_4703:23-655(+)
MISPLHAGELSSGKVLTEEEAALVGTAPRLNDFHGVVFQYACDFKVVFDAGELVLVPRSKGGFCYGVLEKFKMSGTKRIWNVALGGAAVKPVPELWLGKILSSATTSDRDAFSEPQRSIGRSPVFEDVKSVVFAASNDFKAMDVVLLPRPRGGLVYGYVEDVDGNGHCLVRSHVREDGRARRLPNYGIGKLTLTQGVIQTFLGPVLSRGE